MRTSILAVLTGIALTGCVIHEHTSNPPSAIAGDVTVTWSFGDGNTCSSLGGLVDHIHVVVDGEALANAGLFPCQAAGTQGVTLFDFAPGTYDFSVIAETSSGSPLYEADGSFTVNGDVGVSVVLEPVSQAAPGNVAITWTFGDGNTCASLGGFVDHIQVQVDNGVEQENLSNGGIYPCTLQGTQGVELTDFAPGSYNYTVYAESANGTTLYQGQGVFTINGDTQTGVILQPINNAAPGDVDVYWTFPGNASCSGAGVDHVVVSIPGESLANGGVYACSISGVQGVHLTDFAPGTYQISVDAETAGGTVLYGGDSSFTINGDTSVQVDLN